MHFSLKKLHKLTENALAAIDKTFWKKCVLKVLKEARLYLELDGISVPPEYELNFIDPFPLPQSSTSALEQLSLTQLSTSAVAVSMEAVASTSAVAFMSAVASTSRNNCKEG